MLSYLDIYRTANPLIRVHGDQAAIEAAQRADAMLDNGDLDGKPGSRHPTVAPLRRGLPCC